MTQNDDGKPSAPDTDILSAIRRIVDEEQGGGASAATPAPAPAPKSGRSGAMVLTPTMRVNPSDDDGDEAPALRLTTRVDPNAQGEGAQARSLRNAFGRDDTAPEAAPLRLKPVARVDEPTPEAKAPPLRMSGFAGQPAAPGPMPAPAPEPASEIATPKVEAPASAAPRVEVPAPAASAPVAAGMTRDELEALITERLRQDLSGELGTRISANIRTLVQREVSAAVKAAFDKG